MAYTGPARYKAVTITDDGYDPIDLVEVRCTYVNCPALLGYIGPHPYGHIDPYLLLDDCMVCDAKTGVWRMTARALIRFEAWHAPRLRGDPSRDNAAKIPRVPPLRHYGPGPKPVPLFPGEPRYPTGAAKIGGTVLVKWERVECPQCRRVSIVVIEDVKAWLAVSPSTPYNTREPKNRIPLRASSAPLLT